MITTHVLDTALGKPAAHMSAKLEYHQGEAWRAVGQGNTDADGRIRDWMTEPLLQGTYRITFQTGSYFESQKRPTFYPMAVIVFHVVDPQQHYHVPLLLSGYGYSTYRGS